MSMEQSNAPAASEAPAKTFIVKDWVTTVNAPAGKTQAGDPRYSRIAIVIDAKGVEHKCEVLGTAGMWDSLDPSRVQLMQRDGPAQFWACTAPRGAVPASFAL